jgi:hypothetical protein
MPATAWYKRPTTAIVSVEVERRSSAALAAAGILILSVAIVAMVTPLLKTLSFPSLALGGSPPVIETGELVVSAELMSPQDELALSGATFVISSATGAVFPDYVTNGSGIFVAPLLPGEYSITTSDPRFFAQASLHISSGNITEYYLRVTQTDSYPSFYDAVDSDSSGFLDSTESLFVTIPSGDISLSVSSNVTITYLNAFFFSLVSESSSSPVAPIVTVSALATVVSSDVRDGSLYLVLGPSSTIPLRGIILISVSTYSVFDRVSYPGSS